MKKSTWWIVGIVVVVVIILVISGTTKSTKTGPITIGFIGPLSGDGASFGETEKNAVIMAVEEINLSDKFKNQPISVIYEDGKCTGKDATLAIQKLINIDKVKVILGGVCSAETLAVAPIAEKNKVLLFSAFSSNPAISNSGDYIFRNSPSDSDVAKLDAQTILDKNYKKVAIVSENSDYSQGVRNIMKGIIASSSASIVLDETFTGGTTDFRSYVAKVKQSGADVVYINPASSGKTGALFVKQLREAGVKIAVHGNFSLGTPDAYATGKGYLDGIIISDSTKISSRLQILLDTYKQRFGNKAANDFEFGASYDRTHIIADAISAVGYDPDKIKQYLYDMPEYDGVIGKYRFNSNGDVTGGPFFTNYVISGETKELLNKQ
ncbi:MAG: ABC transporter substrate-binding protein [Candidatus Taylorbacteria bacterium]|nr:ABC transporter substrate-binding protein [Candidatus Taylorbacteria bacterium]